MPSQYEELPAGEHTDLYPEVNFQQQWEDGDDNNRWWRFDPRVEWLIDTLKMLKQFKVLVICAHAETALDLEDALRLRSGISATVFHEGMSILERDRAAAYFADEEFGAQVLICSEIGAEGRNFQFAHHLVLFDLPAHGPARAAHRPPRPDRPATHHPVARTAPGEQRPAAPVPVVPPGAERLPQYLPHRQRPATRVRPAPAAAARRRRGQGLGRAARRRPRPSRSSSKRSCTAVATACSS